MNENDKMLSYMVNKNAKTLADDMKVRILNKLIELCETSDGEILIKQELEIIRDGVEEMRNKEKDEDIKSIASVIDNLIGRFGKEDDFEDKVNKKIEIDAEQGVGEK